MLDVYVSGKCSRVSPEAPVPVVDIKETVYQLGGAANVAFNLDRLGCTVFLYGSIGSDYSGNAVADFWRNSLKPESRLFVLQNKRTTTKTRIIANGQQVVRYDEDHFFHWDDPIDVEHFMKGIASNILSSNAVILTDYNKGILSDSLSKELVSFCSRKNVPCFVDPKDGWEKFTGAYCIKPNRYELERNTNIRIDWHSGLHLQLNGICRALNLNYLLVTLGGDGMVLSEQYDCFPIVPIKRDVFDVSGAGDTVIATLAAAHGAGMSMLEAAMLANRAASIVVGKKGTQPITILELQNDCRCS